MADFPQQVQTFMAPAVAGDFCSANPRFSLIAGPGAMVAGTNLYVGRFCWADPTNKILNSNGSGPVSGFMGRNQQGLITQFLSAATMQVLSGIQCFGYSGGDFWVVNNGSLITTVGMKAYANYATGLVAFAATGNPPAGGVVTGSIAAGPSVSVTGAISGYVLTVTAAGTPGLVVGGALSATGLQAGTVITGQTSGTAGGIGVYTVNIPQTLASTTITQSYGVLTVTAVASGALAVGDVVSGANVTGTPAIISLGTGTGGNGTYNVATSQTAASATVNATGYVETKWVCMDVGRAVGELVRISDHALG
jgi:hypothetical protein